MENSVEKKLAILEAITTLHRSVGASLELESVSEIIVRELRRIFHCSGCAVLQVGEEKATVLADCGFSQLMGAREFAKDMPAITYIVDSGHSILTGDVSTGPTAACIPSGCAMRSLICAPIIVAGEVKGIIHIDSDKPDAFDEEDLAFVQILSNEVAVVFERSLKFSRIHSQSLRDSLTGCFNRRALDYDLDAAIAKARGSGHAVSLLMADVDWFKAYNDCHGHLKGDEALVQVADVLRGGARSADRLYRFGGEEFALLLPLCERRNAAGVAQRLCRAVETSRFPGAEESQPEGRMTISMGVAEFPGDANDGRGLLSAADAALFRAKRAGRNRVAVTPLAHRCRSGARTDTVEVATLVG